MWWRPRICDPFKVMRRAAMIVIAMLVIGVVAGALGAALLRSPGGQKTSVVVLDVTRLKQANAVRVLSQHGLAAKVVGGTSTAVPLGQIFMQRPSGGAIVAPGVLVTLSIAKR